MQSKLQAAFRASEIGTTTIIADGRKKDTLQRIFAGSDIGTIVVPKDSGKKRNKRKDWLAHFHKPQGSVKIDKGAAEAIINRGTSLLPIGIKSVTGNFPLGTVLSIKDLRGKVLAHGLSAFSSTDIKKIKGKKSGEIKKILGHSDYHAVVHRDNMVIL